MRVEWRYSYTSRLRPIIELDCPAPGSNSGTGAVQNTLEISTSDEMLRNNTKNVR